MAKKMFALLLALTMALSLLPATAMAAEEPSDDAQIASMGFDWLAETAETNYNAAREAAGASTVADPGFGDQTAWVVLKEALGNNTIEFYNGETLIAETTGVSSAGRGLAISFVDTRANNNTYVAVGSTITAKLYSGETLIASKSIEIEEANPLEISSVEYNGDKTVTITTSESFKGGYWVEIKMGDDVISKFSTNGAAAAATDTITAILGEVLADGDYTISLYPTAPSGGAVTGAPAIDTAELTVGRIASMGFDWLAEAAETKYNAARTAAGASSVADPGFGDQTAWVVLSEALGNNTIKFYNGETLIAETTGVSSAGRGLAISFVDIRANKNTYVSKDSVITAKLYNGAELLASKSVTVGTANPLAISTVEYNDDAKTVTITANENLKGDYCVKVMNGETVIYDEICTNGTVSTKTLTANLENVLADGSYTVGIYPAGKYGETVKAVEGASAITSATLTVGVPATPSTPSTPNTPSSTPATPSIPAIAPNSGIPSGTTVNNADGSTTTYVRDASGNASETTVAKDGSTTINVFVSQGAVSQAASSGEPISLPMKSVKAGSGDTIAIKLPAGTTAKVEIPVSNITPGSVAVLTYADGSEKVVPYCAPTENGLVMTINGGAILRIEDKGRTFKDVPASHTFSEAVEFASARGIIEGYSGGSFGVGNYATSAATATVIARMMGQDFYGPGATTAAQQWASRLGISAGLDLSGNVTRGQYMLMLWRAAGAPGEKTPAVTFPDLANESNEIQRAFAWAVELGLVSGYDDGTVRPEGNITRGAMAAIAMRYMVQQ